MKSFRRGYGAGPIHLVSMLSCLAFAAYLVWTVLPAPSSLRILVWVVAAAVAHDLVLWPLYCLADRLAGLAHQRTSARLAAVPWINHVRVPVVLSAVTLLISFPLVLRHSEATYHAASGLSEHPYLARWLAISGGVFAVSAIAYVVRVVRAVRSRS